MKPVGWLRLLLPGSVIFALCICACGSSGKYSPSELPEVFTKAQQTAEAESKLIFVDFTAGWCPPCKMLEQRTFKDSRVIEKLKKFVWLKIDVDKRENNSLARKYGVSGIPKLCFLKHGGEVVVSAVGYHSPDQMLKLMDEALSSMS